VVLRIFCNSACTGIASGHLTLLTTKTGKS
jgi:hypothetical protein